MKKIFFVLLTVLSVNAFSQTVDFGLKAGMVYPTDDGVIKTINFGIESKGKGAIGFQGGAMMRLKFAGFYLQPEALYSQYKYKDFEGTDETELIKKRIDIPVNVGKTFALGLVQLQTGPVFSLNLDDVVRDFDGNYVQETKNKFNMGWQIGTGVNIKKLNVDLRYEFGLSKSVTKLLNRNMGLDYETSNRTNLLNLSVGYFF